MPSDFTVSPCSPSARPLSALIGRSARVSPEPSRDTIDRRRGPAGRVRSSTNAYFTSGFSQSTRWLVPDAGLKGVEIKVGRIAQKWVNYTYEALEN